MNIPASRLAGVPVGSADVLRCKACKAVSFHDAVSRLVLTPGGARTLVLWQCEHHPLPTEGLTAR